MDNHGERLTRNKKNVYPKAAAGNNSHIDEKSMEGLPLAAHEKKKSNNATTSTDLNSMVRGKEKFVVIHLNNHNWEHQIKD